MAHRTWVKKQILCLLLLSTCLVRPAYSLGTHPPRRSYYIRVAVFEGKDSFQLTIRSAYQIRALNTAKLLSEGKSLRKEKVIPLSEGIKLGRKVFAIYGIKIEPQRDASIYINNRRFRGTIDIIRTEDSRLLVVNHLDIEDYLYGVLPREVPHNWPREALKAQAIAARSFALYRNRIRVESDYDLTSTTSSQVYGGRTSERYRSSRIVNQTRGKILVYKGELFPAYYHATCGGHTTDVRKIWDIALPPLRGVNCPYCKKSPHFLWKQSIPLSEIEDKLSRQGEKIGKISSITPLKRDKSNRIIDLRILGSQRTVLLSAYKFRLYLGPDIIRSTNFSVAITPGKEALFSGFGWGHGVGLCQWGAYFMAKQGYSAEEILNYYYPGAEINNYGDTILNY